MSSPPCSLHPQHITTQAGETSRLATSWESTWCQVLGAIYLVPNTYTKYFVPDTWYQALGTKSLVPAIWYWIPGTWYQVLGTKYLAKHWSLPCSCSTNEASCCSYEANM